MALTGKFLADFSSFYDACQKAEVSVKSIGEGANKVGPALNRMVDQFSGRKLVGDATIMARAIEEIGGVSKLTEKELARVGATMNEAVSKMRLMGRDVPAGMQKIADATKGANKAAIDWMGTLTTIGGAFGVAFSAQQLVSFIGSVFDAAGAIHDLSVEWGVSAEAAQKFTQAAKLSGASAQDVGSAINFMNRELGEGTKQYQALVNAVGLSFDQLRTMSPEAAFRAMVEAVAAIEDPMLQADYAVKLFGRSAQTLLPAIREDFLKVADAQVVMSNETIARLEAVGDMWENLKNRVVIAVGEMMASVLDRQSVIFASWTNFFTNLKFVVTANTEGQKAWIDAQLAAQKAAAGTAAGVSAATKPYGPYQTSIRSTAEVLADQRAQEIATQKAQADRRAEMDRIRKAQDDYNNSLRKLVDAFSGGDAIDKAHLWLQALEKTIPISQMTRAQQDAANKVMADAIAAYTALGEIAPAALREVWLATIKPIEVTNELGAALKGLPTTQLTLWSENAVAAITALPKGIASMKVAPRMFDGFGKSVAGAIGNSILRSIEGGGNILAGIGGTIGNAIMDPAKSGIGKAIAAGAKKLPGILGSTVATMLPGIGSLVGVGVEALGGLFGKLFDKEGKKVNDMRDAFQKSIGTFDQMQRKAVEAGYALENLLSVKKVEAFNAEVAKFQEALKFQESAMAALDEVTARYGFTLEELGPALARQELDKQAQQLFKDFEILNAAGIDTIAITTRMADSINAYVQQAVAMGTEVPDAMRPMLQQMVDMGQLTDENGNLITDLEAAGITFAMTMSEGFQALIKEVGKLTEAISRGLGLAVDTTIKKIENMPKTIPIEIVYHDPGFTAAGAGAVEGFQHGTDGFRNFGAGTPVMLHGWEAVVPRNRPGLAAGTLGDAGGLGAPVVINIDARGALFNDPGSEQRLAERIERALDAKHGLTHKRRAA